MRSWQNYVFLEGPLEAFSSAHGAPAQRFYNLLCLAYGADPKLFADVVEKGYLPQKRAAICRGEYREVAFAFKQLVAPHLDQELMKQVFDRAWLPDAGAQSLHRCDRTIRRRLPPRRSPYRKNLADMARASFLWRPPEAPYGECPSGEKMASAFVTCAAGDALDCRAREQSQDAFAVDVARCRYAEFYKELGAPELGFLLVCSSDFPFVDGLGADT